MFYKEHMELLEKFESVMEKVNAESYKPQLIHIDYRDELTDEQVDLMLEGKSLYESGAFDDWEGESRWEGAKYEMAALMGDDDLSDLYIHYYESWERLLEAVQDKDTSDPETDLLRATGSAFYQSALPVEDLMEVDANDDYSDSLEYRRDTLKEWGLPVTIKNLEAVMDLQHHTRGGYIAAFFYADAENAVNAQRAGGTLENPWIAAIDGWNGACHLEQFEGTIVIPTDSIRRDRKYDYSSVDNICGLSALAFKNDVTINEEEKVAA